VTCVTLTPPTCQFLVRARLAKVVGEVTGTLGVRDFGTPEDLGCSIIERPKRPEGRNHMASLRDFRSSKLWKVSCIDSKEAFNAEVSNFLLACVLDACVRRRVSLVVGEDGGWTSTVGEGTWRPYV
jgi:hypothetical protein